MESSEWEINVRKDHYSLEYDTLYAKPQLKTILFYHFKQKIEGRIKILSNKNLLQYEPDCLNFIIF